MFDIYNDSRSSSTHSIIIKKNMNLENSWKNLMHKFGKGLIYDYIPLFGFDISLFITESNKIYVVALKRDIVFRNLEINYSFEDVKKNIINGRSPLFDIINADEIENSQDSLSKNKRQNDLHTYFVKELILLSNKEEN